MICYDTLIVNEYTFSTSILMIRHRYIRVTVRIGLGLGQHYSVTDRVVLAYADIPTVCKRAAGRCGPAAGVARQFIHTAGGRDTLRYATDGREIVRIHDRDRGPAEAPSTFGLHVVAGKWKDCKARVSTVLRDDQSSRLR